MPVEFPALADFVLLHFEAAPLLDSDGHHCVVLQNLVFLFLLLMLHNGLGQYGFGHKCNSVWGKLRRDILPVRQQRIHQWQVCEEAASRRERVQSRIKVALSRQAW